MSSNNTEPIKRRPRKRNRNKRRSRAENAVRWPIAEKLSSGLDKVMEPNLNKPASAHTPRDLSTLTPGVSDKNNSEIDKTVKPQAVPVKAIKPALHSNFKKIPSIHNKIATKIGYVNPQNSGSIYTVDLTSKSMRYSPLTHKSGTLHLVPLSKPPKDEVMSKPKSISTEEAIYVPDPEDPNISRGFTAYMDKMKVWPWQSNVKEAVIISGIQDDAARTKANYKFLKSTFLHNSRRSYWYKITIVGYSPNSTMETVLDSMIQYVYPQRFIPCFVQFKQKECRFLVTHCGEALLKICFQGLSFTSLTGTKLYLTISLSSESPDFDIILAIHKCIRDRFTKKTGFLDLSNCKVIPYKGKVIIYFPLTHAANQKLIAAKLDYFNEYPVTHLKLCNNRLSNIKDFNIHCIYPRLKTLDLSNNKLSSITTLSGLKGMCVRHVILEGNPLCHDFVTEESYISILKYIFPKLQSVDRVTVANKGYPVSQPNYLVEQDAHTLVDTFLQTFFELFDSEERRKCKTIANLYHKNAILTLTSSPLIVNLVGKIGMIIRHSKTVKERPRVSGIFCGVDEIVRFLNRCPETQHDPQSFNVDVTVHTEKITIVTVSGIFKSPTPGLLEDEPLIYFTRTFVLKPVNRFCYEYKITNDMLYMTKVDEEVAASAYSVTSPQCALSLDFTTLFPDPDLKNKLAEVFMKLTSLSKPQALRCLEVRNWNFRLSLEYFILLSKRNEIHVLGAN